MSLKKTRDMLIDAGVRAMLEKSYHAVGLQGVLDDVKVPKGSFYHYFKSKEDFGLSVIERYAATHAERLRLVLTDASLSPRQRMVTFFAAAREHYADTGCKLECLVAKLGTEMAALNPPMRIALKRAMDGWVELMAQCIREGQAVGEIDSAHDPTALAGFLQDAWEGAMLHMTLDCSLDPIDNYRSYVFSRLLP